MAKRKRTKRQGDPECQTTKLIAYDKGATRTPCLQYELIPQAAIEGLSRRLTLGAERHGKNNWKKGGAAFVEATKSHLVKHLFEFLETGRLEDLDAIGANYAFLQYFYSKGIK